MNAQPKQQLMLLDGMAAKYGLRVEEFAATVRATCGLPNASPEEFAAFVSVCREYGLNPITREIYAMPRKGGGLIPIVSIDGWVHLINSHPQCDGFTFDTHEDENGELVSITCRMYRKDRAHPVEVTEYLSECFRQTEAWKMKRRMLRHKSLTQAGRYTFGFSGIYEEDEAERFAAAKDITPPKPPSLSQPIAAAPMPPYAERPSRMPTPPKPPAKPVGRPRKAGWVRLGPDRQPEAVEEEPDPAPGIDPEPEPEVIDGDTGEVSTPGQMLSDLDDALDSATTEAEIEAIWDEHDLPAKLQNITKGDEFIGVAIGIKRRHLKRVTP